MPLRIVLFLVALAMVVAGVSLLNQSAGMPEWTDEAKFQAIQMWDLPAEDASPQEVAHFNTHWRKAIAKLRTDKWPYHDAGAAMIAFAASLVAGLLILRINTMADVAALKTPRHPWSIYGIGMAGWLLYWVSAVWALIVGINRSEFPPTSGSQITMIVWFVFFAAASAAVLAIVSFFILRKTELPAPMWLWRKDMPGHDWFYTIGTALALLLAAGILYQTYCYGHWLAVPSVFLCVYATLAMRAAGIAKRI